ncbi:MAG: hypothetical protein WD989_00145 [Candidatus Paceibacterota bacterium]
MNLVNKLYNWLTGPVSISRLANESWSFLKAETSVRYFYYILLYLSFINFQWWDNVANRQNFDAIWPIFWGNGLGYETTATVVQFLHLATAFLAAIFFRHRWARFLAFLGMSQFHALESSFGQPTHQWYLFVFVSLLFIFIPDVWKKGKEVSIGAKKNLLLVFWSAQAITFLSYSMSGLGKFLGAYYQYSIGQIHGFSPHAFAYQIADWLPKIQADPVLGSFIINHPLVGWPFYAGIHFVMFFALWAAFRPSLQKLWAFSLILFHVGTYVTMDISFAPPIILLILLFMNSPFLRPETTVKDTVRDFPVVGWLLAKIT